ncbi:DUF4177 domain-containing protein [Litorimonas haliclonae]|uniref:DUF4177 domain-containing protein n=1 Tax=Litorimonas haliclonae TaxID=2081977 RepID=UPI0039EEDA61
MSELWEYKIVQPEKGDGITGADIRAHSTSFLNKHGQEGWECYHVKTDVHPCVFYLKRKL